jgi:D-alanyl-D-alanine carboxypeptidase
MTKKINTSYEWGGGGLVSTTRDMGLFIKGLFDNKLFKNPSTLKKMTDYSVTKKFGENYGMGIYKYELNGKIFYGHGGFYGSILAYDPVEKITFSANIGQANPPYDAGKLVNALMDIIMTK